MLKKVFLLISILLTGVGLMAQDSFELPVEEAFNRVTLLGNYEVILKKGEAGKVEVFNSDDDLDDDRILAEVKEKELKVRIKMDTYSERDLKIVITYVDLIDVTAKFGCVVRIPDTLERKQMELNVESGGKIDATVNVNRLEASIATGGSIHVDGNAEVAAYNVKAGGTIGAANLNATKVEADISMGGEIICLADEVLRVKILSGGEVSYIGDPETFEQKVTFGGTITRIKK